MENIRRIDSRIVGLHTEILENIWNNDEYDCDLILKFRNIVKNNFNIVTVYDYIEAMLNIAYDHSRRVYDITNDTIKDYIDGK